MIGKKIYLIGYMGCGKTYTGRRISDKYGLQFIDLDAYIEKRQFKTIPQLFQERGEEEFRKLERAMLEEVSAMEDVIISTGGGTACFFDNIELMNQTGETIYLQASVDTLFDYLKTAKKGRPLLAQKNDEELYEFINENLIDTRLKDMSLDITDKEMGDLTMNMGLLEMGDISKLGINIRYPHNLDFEKFYESFSDKAKKYGLKCVLGSNSKPHYVDPKSEFVQKLYSTYKKFTNDLSPMKTIGGGTYARELKLGVAFGVLFPKEKEMAHQTDEFANIENLFKEGEIIADAIYNIQ